MGPSAEQCVRFEPEGLRITLQGHPNDGPGTGVGTHLAVKGDFEITVSFEILKEPEPEETTGNGTRFAVMINMPERCVARINRGVHADGGTEFWAFSIVWDKVADREQRRNSNSKQTVTKTGRLRIVRSSSDLTFYGAEGANDFTLVGERKGFGAQDLDNVALVGQVVGPKAALDVRFTDLRIRAESLPQAPVISVQKVVEKGWLAVGLVLAMLITLTLCLGVWLFMRYRRRPVV
jgi:hypothetical protein